MGSLDITITGPASRLVIAEQLSTAECTIRPVAQRCAVVLIAVFGDVEPTRADLDLINAVSQATGRCAVALVGNSPANPLWRRAVPTEIPVGEADEKMGRTLYLLGEGPPRAHGRSAIQARHQLVQEQLVRERSRRAQQHASSSQQLRVVALEIIQSSLQDFVDVAPEQMSKGWCNPTELEHHCETIASSTEARLASELDCYCRLRVPPASTPDRSRYVVEFVLGLLVFGAAVGVGKLLAEPLVWLGASTKVSGIAAVVVGIAIAAVVVWGNVRRKAQQTLRAWVARYAVDIRRNWEREVDVVLQKRVASESGGWRARALAEAMRTQ